MSEDYSFENLFPHVDPDPEPVKGAVSLMDEYNAESWLKPTEVSQVFGVDPKTVTRWRKAGKLSAVRSFKTPGGHTRYFAPDIRKLMDNNENASGE